MQPHIMLLNLKPQFRIVLQATIQEMVTTVKSAVNIFIPVTLQANGNMIRVSIGRNVPVVS